MKVFLTGGTGFIGRSLTAELLRRGWDVVALARHPESPRGRELAALGADCARGDVTDRDSIRAGMGGADLVIHAAGHYEFGVDRAGRERMVRTNVDGTDTVLNVALELGVPRIVYV